MYIIYNGPINLIKIWHGFVKNDVGIEYATSLCAGMITFV